MSFPFGFSPARELRAPPLCKADHPHIMSITYSLQEDWFHFNLLSSGSSFWLEVQEGAASPAHGNQRSGREAQPEWIA